MTSLLLLSFAVSAASPSRTNIPPPLQSWIPWALRDAADQACPLQDEERVCRAMSRLSITASTRSATFEVEGERFSEGLVPLPGDSLSWPRDVRSAGRPVPVVGDEGHPWVRLPSGKFRVQGTFAWDDRPNSVDLPGEAAVLSLRVDGKPAARDVTGGRMWLEPSDPQPVATSPVDTVDNLQLRVFRKLSDGSPSLLETRLRLSVGGRERKLELGAISPAGSRPIRMSGGLPGRLLPGGRIALTLRPGEWDVVVVSVLPGDAKIFHPAREASPWPEREVWSFEEDPDFRSARALAPQSVDPLQAGVDAQDRRLPAWSLAATDSLVVTVVSRGVSNTTPPKATLERLLVLDRDGIGASFQDKIQVATSKAMRLSVAYPFQPERMEIDERARVFTTSRPGEAGVNIERGVHRVGVEGRLEGGSWNSLPSKVLDEPPQSATFRIAVPRGWMVIGPTGGLDEPGQGTWLSTWSVELGLQIAGLALLVGFCLGRRWWIPGALAGAAGAAFGFPLLSWLAGLALWALILSASRRLPPGPLRQALQMAPRLIVALVVLDTAVWLAKPWEQIWRPTSEAFSPVASNFRMRLLEARARRMEGISMQDQTASVVQAPSPPPPAQELSSSPASVMRNSVMDRMESTDGLLGEDVDPDEANMIDVILAGGHRYDAAGKTASGGATETRNAPVPADIELGGSSGAEDEATGDRTANLQPVRHAKHGPIKAGRASHNPSSQLPPGTKTKPRTESDAFLQGIVQAGSGIPTPEGPQASVFLEHPVAGSVFQWWVLPRGWANLLRLVALGLAALLSCAAWREAWKSRIDPKPPTDSDESAEGPAHSWTAMFVLFLCLGLASNARSQTSAYPSEKMLTDLKDALVAPPDCGGPCADISQARVESEGNRIKLNLAVEAFARTVVPLPRSRWELDGISCGNCASGADHDGPWVVVGPGRTDVVLSGHVDGNDASFTFPLPPRSIRLALSGWRRDDQGNSALHLVRTAPTSARGTAPDREVVRENGAVPFVRLERRFHLEREWTVETDIVRVGDFDGAVSLAYPLLPGESSLDGQSIDSGKARWILPAGSARAVFRTRLPRTDSLRLVAAAGPWTESWSFRNDERFELVHRGIPPSGSGTNRWTPLPGETLFVSLESHKPVEGAKAVLLAARARWENRGGRSAADMELRVRATSATELLVKEPEGAVLTEAFFENRLIQPARAPDGRWRIPIQPCVDSRLQMSFALARSVGPLVHAPRVELSLGGVDFHMERVLDPGTFALAQGGDGSLGFALWWIFLPMVAGASWLCSRKFGGFPTWSWMLLLVPATTGAGFIHTHGLWALALAPFLLAWRSRQDPNRWNPAGFSLVQWGIAATLAWAVVGAVGLVLQPLLGTPAFALPVVEGGVLSWTLPRSGGALPTGWAIVLPLWIWRTGMAAWSIWVLYLGTKWIPKAKDALMAGGWSAPQPEPGPDEEPVVDLGPATITDPEDDDPEERPLV